MVFCVNDHFVGCDPMSILSDLSDQVTVSASWDCLLPRSTIDKNQRFPSYKLVRLLFVVFVGRYRSLPRSYILHRLAEYFLQVLTILCADPKCISYSLASLILYFNTNVLVCM